MSLFFELTNHKAYKVSGADKERYLQGRLTQNIKTITTAASLLLTPQGKILAKVLIHKESDCYIFIADPAEDFVTNLLKFKVADDVKVEEINCDIFSVIGEFNTDLKKITSNRYDDKNYDVLVPKEERELFISSLNSQEFKLADEKHRTFLRIQALKPEYGAEIDQNVVATEIPYQELISFNKGCYAGQEVVEMSTARGKPNKQLVALKAESLIASSDLYSSADKSKSCGTIKNSVNFQGQNLAFAFIKSAFAELNEFFNAEQKLVKLT